MCFKLEMSTGRNYDITGIRPRIAESLVYIYSLLRLRLQYPLSSCILSIGCSTVESTQGFGTVIRFGIHGSRDIVCEIEVRYRGDFDFMPYSGQRI